jgi:metal-dependent amidase/aminoacylase/carboxypeptidase family protein
MAALEASLDVPALVAKLTGPNADRDKVVARAKELMDKELLALADDIATHPEIGFEEKRSVGKLVDYLQKHDFSVETGSAG